MKRRRGQSIMEAMIAAGIMVISISAVAAMMLATERGAVEMIEEVRASALAEEGIHASISIRDRDWDSLSVGVHGLAIQASPLEWVFQGNSDASDGFTRTVTVSSIDSDTRKVSVVVSWSPDGKRTASVEEQALLTDWGHL
jgi:Tfp pilus assembly protein PilV